MVAPSGEAGEAGKEKEEEAEEEEEAAAAEEEGVQQEVQLHHQCPRSAAVDGGWQAAPPASEGTAG